MISLIVNFAFMVMILFDSTATDMVVEFINSFFSHHVVLTGSPELELVIVTVQLLSVS